MLIDVAHFISTKLAKYDLPDDAVNAAELRLMLVNEPEAVVRCKECVWWDITDQGSTLTPFSGRCKRVYRLWADRDAFCSYGESREDETD